MASVLFSTIRGLFGLGRAVSRDRPWDAPARDEASPAAGVVGAGRAADARIGDCSNFPLSSLPGRLVFLSRRNLHQADRVQGTSPMVGEKPELGRTA